MTKLTKLSFNAIPAAMQALGRCAEHLGLSRTDTANRAFQAYDALLSVEVGQFIEVDGRTFVRVDPADG